MGSNPAFDGESSLTTRFAFLASLAAVSIVAVACGTYSAADGTGGSSGGSGGSSQSGGATTSSGGVTSSGGSVSSGGANGGAGGSETGGTAAGGAQSGGAQASGGAVAKGGASGATTAGGATTSGGVTGAGGVTASGGTTGARTGGTTGSTGGTTARNGGATTSTGGATTSTGGTTASTGGTTGTGGTTTPAVPLPCELFNGAPSNKCVSAHSTVRVIVPDYTGPLYQLCKGTANTGPSSCKGTPQDVAAKDGYADVAAHEAFCPTGTACTITKIYDQSGQGNHLEPAPRGNICGPDKPANAGDLKITINGHSAYGVLIKPGMGYRTGCTGCNIKVGNGMVKGDAPESMYWVTSQKDLVDGCCFDYGNAETSSNDDGNGTMETLYFGGGVVWGTGAGGKPGPWMMADLENGLYAGWENGQDKNISTNTALKYNFVTGIVLGDSSDKNNNKGRFAIYGGDATSGVLKTMYDGIRPDKGGYAPMKKQGSIILGIGGDNSCSGGGHFYEGAVSAGPVISKATVDALQAAIVAARYGK